MVPLPKVSISSFIVITHRDLHEGQLFWYLDFIFRTQQCFPNLTVILECFIVHYREGV